MNLPSTDTPLEKRVSTVGLVQPHLEVKIVDPDTGEIIAMNGETINRAKAHEISSRGVSRAVIDVNGREVVVFSNGMVDAADFVHFSDDDAENRRIIKEGDLEFNQFPQILAYWRSKDGPFGDVPPRRWVNLFYDLRARADGKYYVPDFTLAEIRSLQMTENFKTENGKQVPVYPDRFPLWQGSFKIHTFEEELQFVRGLEKSSGKRIGIYPEIKAPWLHHQEGKDIARATLAMLKKYGYTQKSDPVYLQTFDFNELKRIKTELLPQMGMNVKLVQLVAYSDWGETQARQNGRWVNYDYDWMFKPGAMKEIARYADGVGPAWYMLLDEKQSRPGHIVATPMAADIQTTQLQLHPYTVRRETLPPYVRNIDEMYAALFEQAKADGIFTDFPDTLAQYLKK
mgnify:CR=1 FL=1